MHADGACEGGVDIERLAGDALALGRPLNEVQRAHIVQPVRQLHQKDADVLRDGQDELTKVLRLTRPFGGQLQLGELGDALDKISHLFAEHLCEIVVGGRGVLDHVVQKGGDDRRRVHAVFGQDARHLDRVGEIGIPGGPKLSAVHAHAIDVGAVEKRLIRRRVVALDPLDQLILTEVSRGFAYPLRRVRLRRIRGGRKKGCGDRKDVRDRLEDERFCARGRQ